MELRQALAGSGCAPAKATDRPVVACGDDVTGNAGRAAMLLGPPIVTGTHVANARAGAPNQAQGQPQWTVSLTFDHTGAAAWGDYTTEHNLSSAPKDFGFAAARTCTSIGTPCADFVGFVVDGSVVSLPVNESPIRGGATQISGAFDKASAKKLARELSSGQLSVPLSRTSVTTTD